MVAGLPQAALCVLLWVTSDLPGAIRVDLQQDNMMFIGAPGVVTNNMMFSPLFYNAVLHVTMDTGGQSHGLNLFFTVPPS